MTILAWIFLIFVLLIEFRLFKKYKDCTNSFDIIRQTAVVLVMILVPLFFCGVYFLLLKIKEFMLV